jgi:hypothetical protein
MDAQFVSLDTMPYLPPVEESDATAAKRSAELQHLPKYESNASDEERALARARMRGQLADISEQPGSQTLTVSCGSCGVRLYLVRAYRCLYCGVWFCRVCAQLHFGMRVPDDAPARKEA